METIVAGIQTLFHVWFGFFLGISIHKYANFSYLFSKYNYPAFLKMFAAIVSFFVILNLPQIIEASTASIDINSNKNPIISLLGTLAEGGIYGIYLILLTLAVISSIRFLQEIEQKGTYLKNLEQFSAMSPEEVVQWAFNQIERPTGNYDLKKAQNAILENHPCLKDHVLFKTNPNNIRYVQPVE